MDMITSHNLKARARQTQQHLPITPSSFNHHFSLSHPLTPSVSSQTHSAPESPRRSAGPPQ